MRQPAKRDTLAYLGMHTRSKALATPLPLPRLEHRPYDRARQDRHGQAKHYMHTDTRINAKPRPGQIHSSDLSYHAAVCRDGGAHSDHMCFEEVAGPPV